ncbi:MAG: anthrone oxygenase family protein [Pseudomonadota bacterium]
MPHHWTVYVCLAIGLNAALVGGVFQSFSDFVMRGLALASPAAGIESMQGLNRTVFRSLFLTTFFVLVPSTLFMAYVALVHLGGAAQQLILFGTTAYIILVFVVTIIGNVPMNERLARLPATSAEAAAYWSNYVQNWTRWNHLRTIGSILTSGSYLFAMLVLAKA